jgi:hypothetical protein
MKRTSRLALVLCGLVLVGVAVPASATQLGVGLHYLRTIDEYKDIKDFSQNDFSLFGSVTIPLTLLKIEGDLEWTPDYVGSSNHLIQPAAYGFVDLGLLYGGVGIGIGYLTGDNNGWASNPFYALRAGAEFGLAGFAFDAFASYRFQSASFTDGVGNFNLDALTLAAQIKFGI